MKKILLIIVIFSCFFVKAQNEKIGDSSVTVHAVLNGKTRAIPKKITLYWDVSLSMQNRNIEGELSLLSNYLKSLNYPEVEVVEFSSGHYKAKVFEASKSKTKNLLKYLKQVDYNGATDYSKILKTNIFNAEVVLLFTNGNAVMSSLESKINISIYCVNSLENARHKKLQEIANFSGGYYINLEKKSIDEALTFMLSEKEDLDVYENDKLESNRKGDVSGTIFSISGQIQGATIRTKDNFLEEESDIDGNYIIDAKLGDVLIVDYLGMLQREVIVSNIKQPLNIELQPEGEVLDEVLVSAKVEKEDKLSYYDKKQKTAGYSSYQIDVKSRHQNLVDVLSGVPGLTVSYNGTYPIFNLMRSYYAGDSGGGPSPPNLG
ncbi:MAG: hypothetical protein JKZ03_06410, partial [Flavobacteriaceae bacterium]|nr:hypothetical protein [Flavobacteriaceae bacterium]